MEQTSISIDEKSSKSIDSAIKDCNDKISTHRIAANKLFIVLIGVVMFFLATIYLKTYFNKENLIEYDYLLTKRDEVSYQLSENLTELRYYSKEVRETRDSIYLLNLRLREALKRNFTYDSYYRNDIRDTIIQLSSTIENYLHRSVLSQRWTGVSDSLIRKIYNANVLNGNSIISESSTYETYISYGIAILLFGVFSSLYRFHLKEISKQEHFLLGFQRIRIAGNNDSDGFGGNVRTSLVTEAFVFEKSKPVFEKSKKIESPIPGHPTSDFMTIIFNKILESIEIKTKDRP